MRPLVVGIPEAAALIGVGRTTLYALEAEPGFPRKVSLSGRRVGYFLAELEAWLAARPRVAQPTVPMASGEAA